MIALRYFSNTGVEKFRSYLENLRNRLATPYPDLNTEPDSLEFQPKVMLNENRKFKTRLEMAKYIEECFKSAGIQRAKIVEEYSMWTWLAYIWLPQLLENGEVYQIEKYICSSDWNRYYRHFVAGGYSIYSLHREENSKLFLENHPPHEIGDVLEQLASRQYMVSSGPIIETACRLYWDPNLKKVKKGATDKEKLGALRRFVKIIGQLELTYDLYSMTSSQILALLPSEFNKWQKTS